MSVKKLYLKRSWLNPAASEDTGHLRSDVKRHTWTDEGAKEQSVDAKIAFGDCYRKVEFNFSCYTKAQARQRIAKLNLMLKHIYNVRECIENEIEGLR